MYVDPDGTKAKWWNPTTWNWKKIVKYSAIAVVAVATIASVVASGGATLGLAICGFATGVGVNFISNGVSNLKNGKNFIDGLNPYDLFISGISGAFFAVGGLAGTIAVGALSEIGKAANHNESWDEILIKGAIGGFSAGVGKTISGFIVSNTLLKNGYVSNALIITTDYKNIISLPSKTNGIIRGTINFILKMFL